jgi:hypothetical protein
MSAAPQALAAAAGEHPDDSPGGIRVARRRLSVVSDNKLIEGVSHIAIDEAEALREEEER